MKVPNFKKKIDPTNFSKEAKTICFQTNIKLKFQNMNFAKTHLQLRVATVPYFNSLCLPME